jgi:hypothetical protein
MTAEYRVGIIAHLRYRDYEPLDSVEVVTIYESMRPDEIR